VRSVRELIPELNIGDPGEQREGDEKGCGSTLEGGGVRAVSSKGIISAGKRGKWEG